MMACEDENLRDEPPPSAGVNPEGFGAPYEIVMNRSPDLPDEPPHLVGDTLVAHVAYPGGCEDHDFRLGYHLRPDTTQLWLHHRAGGERCSTRINDVVRLPVPDTALTRPTLLLVMPQDSVPYVLTPMR